MDYTGIYKIIVDNQDENMYLYMVVTPGVINDKTAVPIYGEKQIAFSVNYSATEETGGQFTLINPSLYEDGAIPE